MNILKINPYDLISENVKEIFSINKSTEPSICKIPIKATTIQSSKGLSADIVFLAHFEDRFLIRNDDKTIISDFDICNFLVSITRAKKKLYILSTDKELPTFLKWLPKSNYDIL